MEAHLLCRNYSILPSLEDFKCSIKTPHRLASFELYCSLSVISWLGVKKIPVVPVSYRETIRFGRSEIIFFLNIFFMVFSIISVTTDTIFAAARNHMEKIGLHSQLC
jgi:hypothetical protein